MMLVQLGKIAKVQSGFAFKSKDWRNSGIPVIRIQNVRSGRVTLEGCSFVSQETADSAMRYFLSRGDVLITMTGEIGSVGVVRDDQSMLLNQRVGRITPTSTAVDLRYLAFALQDPRQKLRMESYAYGAAQPNISPALIGSLPIWLPEVTVQERIAVILDNFDTLIENNRRRIEILEEMARLLYREWFVHFRFPGHEDCKLVDSDLGAVPDSWEVARVADALETVGGGTPSKQVEDYWLDGEIPWFTPTDLTRAGSTYVFESGSRITELGLKKSSAKLFPAGSVMMTSRATIGVVSISTAKASTNQGFITCVPSERLTSSYVYHWLQDNVSLFLNLAGGATFKELRKSTFRELLILVPSGQQMEEFEGQVGPIMALIRNLLRQNELLCEARNLLLPRLVSGELDVSELDLGLAAV